MNIRTWRPRPRYKPLASAFLFLLLLLLVGPGVVEDVIERPGWWNYTVLAALLLVAVVYTWTLVHEWRTRGQTLPEPLESSLDLVFAGEVDHAVKTTATKIAAIKVLRERNPGLGLRDAVTLIDSAYESEDSPAT